jgi:hypothetical protein
VRALLIALLLAGCKRPEEKAAPSASIAISGTSWSALRSGEAPVLRGPHDLFVYVISVSTEDRLSGVAIGSEAGPELTLLAGKFAPLLIPDRSDELHAVKIAADGSTLAIDFRGAFTARVSAEQGRVRLIVDGRAHVVVPSGETMVKGFAAGAPRFAQRVTAWSEASLESHAVDRIEVDTERRGTIVVESRCAPRLMRPRARANTSSFLLRLGPTRDALDPLYAPEHLKDADVACTGGSTVTVGRP